MTRAAKPKRNRTGPKTELTEAFITEFCKYIANGVGFDDACLMCNKDKGHVNKWLQKGKQLRISSAKNFPVYKKFAEEYRRAQLVFRLQLEKDFKATSAGVWTAVAWRLERLCPDVYHRDGAELYAMRKEAQRIALQQAKLNLETAKLEQERIKAETKVLKKSNEDVPLTPKQILALLTNKINSTPTKDPD
jgi:hypothetical protein